MILCVLESLPFKLTGKEIEDNFLNGPVMKDFVVVFVLCTVLQLAVSVLYFLLTGTIHSAIIIGFLLYLASAVSLYKSYRYLARKKEKQQLLDALP